MKEKIYQAFNRNDSPYNDLVDKLNGIASDYQELAPLSLEEKDALQSYDESFLVRFTYNSNAIEGSTMTMGDTALVLEGEFVPGKPGKEHFMARGVAEGYDYALQAIDEGIPLSEELIKDVHLRTALDNQPRTRGIYRTSAVYLKGSDVVPVNPLQIRESMADLLYAYENSSQTPLLKIAAFHTMFENIYPFQDANGRTGRTLMNYLLLQEGYLPVVITSDGRSSYLKGLEDWQLRGESSMFMMVLSKSLRIECGNRSEAVLQTRQATLSLTGKRGTFQE